jgi:hypothetical protein
MNGLLSLMFWTIFARLLVVKIGIDKFNVTFLTEMEAYLIQLSHTILCYFLLQLFF